MKQSLEWIRDHPYASNHDVPEALRQMWSLVEDDDPTRPSELHLAIFSFGYLQRLLLSDGKPPEAKRAVRMEELLEHFRAWQVKLALSELHRKSAVQSKPLPLFAFPAGEKLEYWPTPPFDKPATD